jgi:iron-sulfur cluster assembly protein
MISKELPLTITPKALQEVWHIIRNKNIPSDYALRIGIKGGGCGALGFMLGFDHAHDTDDAFISSDELPVLIDRRHLMYVIGLTLDFEETAEARGFTFIKAT